MIWYFVCFFVGALFGIFSLAIFAAGNNRGEI